MRIRSWREHSIRQAQSICSCAIVFYARECHLRIFKTKGVCRFARRERIADVSLKAAIERAERGSIDANLGGGFHGHRWASVGRW
ncbi:type II toxin-antitoxin system RelE/ParE family toxin [Pigmentiphaga sp. YJ18]|uniref:type II toxin-antitoxin system RelE/ParE family toxin n=1 Tax=Pigmentiphaga sp. YJ18 TaxID=3134907 RepID=UPI004053CCD4